MKCLENLVESSSFPPLLVVPEHGGVRGQISRQVTPVTAILELVEDAIKNLTFSPQWWSSLLLGRQEWLNNFPFCIAQVAGVCHFCFSLIQHPQRSQMSSIGVEVFKGKGKENHLTSGIIGKLTHKGWLKTENNVLSGNAQGNQFRCDVIFCAIPLNPDFVVFNI